MCSARLLWPLLSGSLLAFVLPQVSRISKAAEGDMLVPSVSRHHFFYQSVRLASVQHTEGLKDPQRVLSKLLCSRDRYPFLNFFSFIFSFHERKQAGGEGCQGERQTDLASSDWLSNCLQLVSWTRLKPGAQNSAKIFPCSGKDCSPWTITSCFPGYTSAGCRNR